MARNQPDPSETYHLVNELKRKIVQNRDEYKSLLSEFYKQKPPFIQGRDINEENFTDDLNQYLQMIAHSLIIGNSDILYEYGIKPIEEDVKVLVCHDDLSIYIQAFQDKFDDSTSDSEKFYLAMLIRAIRTANGERVFSEIIRAD